MIVVNTPGNNRMESRRARAGTCGALGLILLLAASEAYTVESPTAKRGEIRGRELDASSVPSRMKGGKKAGPAIVPGKPDESPLVQFLRGLREPQMPKGNPALSEDEVHLVRLWILAGAKDDSASVAAEEKQGDSTGTGGNATLVANDSGTQKALNALLFSG